MTGGPSRRITDHIHADYWTRANQERFEDLTKAEIEKLEKAIDRLTQRVTMLLGGIGLLIFVIPIISPWVRSFVGVP